MSPKKSKTKKNKETNIDNLIIYEDPENIGTDEIVLHLGEVYMGMYLGYQVIDTGLKRPSIQLFFMDFDSAKKRLIKSSINFLWGKTMLVKSISKCSPGDILEIKLTEQKPSRFKGIDYNVFAVKRLGTVRNFAEYKEFCWDLESEQLSEASQTASEESE